MSEYRQFGHLLRKYRNRSGLTQLALANRCKHKQSWLSQLESGHRRPSKDFVVTAKRALKLSTEETALFYLAAGYSEDDEGVVTENAFSPFVRSVLPLLIDPALANLPEPVALESVQQFIEGWHHYALAKASQYNREWKDTEIECKQAAEKLRSATDYLEAHLYDAMGSAALHLGNVIEAERRFAHVEALLPGIDDPYVRGQLLAHQGEVLRTRGEWRLSEQKFQAANRAFLDLDDDTKCAWIDKKLGLLYLMQNHWIKGNTLLERCIEVFKESNNTYEMAKTYIALGWGYTQSGDWHRALNNRQEALKLTQRHRVMGERPDEFLQMQGHVYLGLTLHQLGFLEDGLRHLNTAKEISDRLQEMHERSTILSGLSNAYFDCYKLTGDKECLTLADSYAQVAVEESRQAQDRRRYARAMMYQGSLWLRPGMLEEAINLLEEARRIFRALEHHYYLASVAIYLGEAYMMSGEYGPLGVGVDEGIKEAQTYRHAYYRQLSQLRVLKAYASCYQNRYEEAVDSLASALADAILFNRYQVEAIADQMVMLIAKDRHLQSYITSRNAPLQGQFKERTDRDKQTKELSIEQRDLVTEVQRWLRGFRADSQPVFPKRAKDEMERLKQNL